MKMKSRTRTMSVTSGKGGVGKTSLVCNLAHCLATKGRKVLILDGDLGMANVDIMFGKKCFFSVEDVLTEKCRLVEIITQVAPNIWLIPGGSGVYGLSRLSIQQKQLLIDQINEMDLNFDDLIIDTAPGIDDNVLYLNMAAQEILIVVTPDPSSITDAYALMKVLNQRHHETRFSLVFNLVKDEAEAKSVYKRISDTANKHLCISLDFKGFVPLDLNLRQATKLQQLVTASQPQSPAGLAIRKLAENIGESRAPVEMKGGLQLFWQQLSGVA